MTEIVERLRAGYAGDAPFPFDRAPMALTVEPVYLVRDHDMREIAASLAAKDKEISTLKMALDDETNGISAACRDTETLAAKDAEIKRLGKCYDLAMKSRLEWRHCAEQAERALAEAVEVMRPFTRYEAMAMTVSSYADYAVHVKSDVDDQPHYKHFAAARAFVAQHGSDSREGK